MEREGLGQWSYSDREKQRLFLLENLWKQILSRKGKASWGLLFDCLVILLSTYIECIKCTYVWRITLLAARLKCLDEIEILANLDNEFIIRWNGVYVINVALTLSHSKTCGSLWLWERNYPRDGVFGGRWTVWEDCGWGKWVVGIWLLFLLETNLQGKKKLSRWSLSEQYNISGTGISPLEKHCPSRY